jgi:hypothetical protein
MPFPRRRSRFAVFVVLVAGLGAPAAAQDGVDWGGLMAGIAHGTATDQAAQQSVASRRSTTAPKPAPATSTAKLTYTPSLERRRANLAQFIERSRRKDPQGAAQLEKELGSGDVFAKMGQALSPYGMRIDNVADAYAIWWLDAWLASRQRNDTPPARQIKAVRAQAARAIASLPEMARASDAVKQEMAEAYLIQTLVLGSIMEGQSGAVPPGGDLRPPGGPCLGARFRRDGTE